MTTRADLLPVPVPGVRATRWSTDELYAGMKETYAIGRIEAGRSEWWSRGKVWRCGPGSLQILQPGDVHRDVSRDGPGTGQCVTLSAQMVESAIGKVYVHTQLAADDERGAAFHRLHHAVRAGADRLVIEAAVAEAIAALAALGDAQREHTRPVRRAIELLRERLAEPVTLDDLAAHAGLDKYHLCRAFRAQVGMSPYAYLTRLRIMRAKEMLAAGVKPRDIAPQVGLYDQSQLNRHFRRIVGTTPGQYARSA
ncbi:AraC family transcriptional regulator [Sorangium cellulosum]|uniref:AraC family transcriptional regulator n=1 Tax=Sorangium cellulosum TaxID=56 RepID=A0A150TQ55_SORCE|nr:AraC family transcriptional regulator [Sorangium cellulosum]